LLIETGMLLLLTCIISKLPHGRIRARIQYVQACRITISSPPLSVSQAQLVLFPQFPWQMRPRAEDCSTLSSIRFIALAAVSTLNLNIQPSEYSIGSACAGPARDLAFLLLFNNVSWWGPQKKYPN
jgi:hypothetical protein